MQMNVSAFQETRPTFARALAAELGESAVILFFVAGEKVLWDMVLALHASEVLRRAKFKWEVRSLSGETPKQQARELRERLNAQSCRPQWTALFLVCTAGSAEDG